TLQYLRMPEAARDTFPVGLVHREAERVVTWLRDPEATAVVIVTTAEEMPANETAEIYAGLGDLGMPRSLLVVNQVHEAPATEAELAPLRDASSRAGEPGRAARRAGRATRDDRPNPALVAPSAGLGRRAQGKGDRSADHSLFGEVLDRAEEEAGWAA